MLQLATNTQNDRFALFIFKRMSATRLRLNNRLGSHVSGRSGAQEKQPALISPSRTTGTLLLQLAGHPPIIYYTSPVLSILLSLSGFHSGRFPLSNLISSQILSSAALLQLNFLIILFFSSSISIFPKRGQFSTEILYLVFYFLEHINRNLL